MAPAKIPQSIEEFPGLHESQTEIAVCLNMVLLEFDSLLIRAYRIRIQSLFAKRISYPVMDMGSILALQGQGSLERDECRLPVAEISANVSRDEVGQRQPGVSEDGITSVFSGFLDVAQKEG